MPKKSPPNFETALEELEKIVAAMETEQLSLEESIKQFQRGVELTRYCQQALTEAEAKINILVETNGSAKLVPFEEDGP